MEELIKILDIGKIEFLCLRYIDNKGNFKEVRIDYPNECLEAKEDK
jgi:hypothetical protein